MLMLKQLSIQCIRNVLNYDLVFKTSNVGFFLFKKIVNCFSIIVTNMWVIICVRGSWNFFLAF